MRWFVLTLLLTGLGLSASEPTEAALKFLKGLQQPGASMEVPGNLAISPFCGPGKLRSIHESWNRRALWLTDEKVDLSPGIEKIEGDLAAVLIEAVPADGPEFSVMIALGLHLEDGDWKVAPIEASFENVGLGFGSDVRKRIEELTFWMASERVTALAEMRRQKLKMFNETLMGAVDPALLKTEDPREALEYFLNAAENGTTNEVLVWLGFLERDEFEERDWDREIRVTRLGMKAQDSRKVWRLLTSGNVMKVIMEREGDADSETASYMVSFLASFEAIRYEKSQIPARFHLTKTTGGWRVQLPAIFSQAEEDEYNHRDIFQDETDWEDRENSKEMGRVFEEKNEGIRAAGPAELIKAVIEDLASGDLNGYLRKLYREKEVEEVVPEGDADQEDDDEEGEVLPEIEDLPLAPNARLQMRIGGRGKLNAIDVRRLGRYLEAVTWWSSGMGAAEEINATLQEVFREDGLAVGVLLIEPTGGAWEPFFLNVWMGLGEDGWVVIPGQKRPMENSYDKSLGDARDRLIGKIKAGLPKMKEASLIELMSTVSMFDSLGEAVPEVEGRKIVEDWRMMLGNGSMKQLLAGSAIRKVPDKPEMLLRALGFVRAGAAASTLPDRILGSKAVGRLRGFSLMVDEGRGLEMACPLLLVVPTKNGPRVLADAEIFLETNKAKRMRNAENLELLEAEMSKEDFASLTELVEWHEETSRPAWTEWNNKKTAEQ